MPRIAARKACRQISEIKMNQGRRKLKDDEHEYDEYVDNHDDGDDEIIVILPGIA